MSAVLHKKAFPELTVDELYELLRVRSEVFVVEQDCVYQDMDGDDQASIHLWLTEGDKIVALCRVCPAGTHMQEISIGRVITTERGMGYGKRIMQAGIAVAREYFGAQVIDIEAQEYAKGFYEQAGFRQSSEPFMLDGIPHIKMTWKEEMIETQRIQFRPWKESDAEALFKYASDPDVGPRAGWPPHGSVEDSREVIRKFFSNDHTWALVLKETGEPIGCMGYYTYGESNIGIGENDAELGYWIAKPYWNQGLCTEALQAMIDYCFNKKGFETLWSDFFVDNPASGRVMQKCGFRDTGAINWCSHLYRGDERPVKVMRLDSKKPSSTREGLHAYIEAEIIPRYRDFDKAHREEHVRSVIAQALELARYYDVDPDLVYAAAAYHDTGLAVDRATHHLESGKVIRADGRLREWFTADEIETVAEAAEDHRASAKTAPRSIYGRLIAEADRLIDPMTIVRRTIQFGLSHYPELDTEGHWERTLEHLREKYGDGGYLQLWIPESPNAAQLEKLRRIIREPETLRCVFDKLFVEETAAGRG